MIAALNAAEAERIGLVDRVLPRSPSTPMAIDRQIAGNLPAAETKRAISKVSAAGAIASFARLRISDAHWQAVDRLRSRNLSPQ